MIATVYGRFHYALDTLAGAALAFVVVMGYRYVFGDCLGPSAEYRSERSRSRIRFDRRWPAK
jgi:membrane-associated phospholipid phosphatase